MVFFFENHKHLASLKTFALRIFFLGFLKYIGWYGHSYVFLAVLNMFRPCFV